MDAASKFSKCSQHIIAALCTAVIVCTAFSAANPVIEISPKVINVGKTENLKVSCAFNRAQTESFDTLYNLVMFEAKNNTGHFTELAKVSAEGGVEIEPNGEDSFYATGKIDNHDISYIVLTWPNPKEDQVGVYKCLAKGANNLGMPVSLSSMPTVELVNGTAQWEATSPVNITSEEINIIRQSLADLAAQLSNLKKSIPDMLDTVDTKQGDYTKSKDNIKLAQKAMFLPSTPFNNKRYWLTRYPSFFDAGSAQTTCMIYGGYLAEMDTYDELDFLRLFVKRYSFSFTAVVVGGFHEDHEGVWQNLHSATPMLLWEDKKPYNKNENCLCLWKWKDFNLGDCPCHYASKQLAYVCEIPVNVMD